MFPNVLYRHQSTDPHSKRTNKNCYPCFSHEQTEKHLQEVTQLESGGALDLALALSLKTTMNHGTVTMTQGRGRSSAEAGKKAMKRV